MLPRDGEHAITARQSLPGGGESFDSGALTVRIDTQAPAADAWHSAAEHGEGVGEALLEIADDGTFSEPRMAGVARLLIDFSEAIDPATFAPESAAMAGNDADGQPVDLSGIVVATSTAEGDTLGIIDFAPALLDVGRYLVQIEGITDLAGNLLAGDNDRVFTSLLGDSTGDLRVNAIDLSYIWPRRTTLIDGVSEDQTRSDVTCDGRVNAIDLSAAWPRRGADMRNVPDPVLSLAPGGSGTWLWAESAAAEAAAARMALEDGAAAETPRPAQPQAHLAIRSEANVQPAATFRRPPAPGVVTVAAGTQGLEAAAAPSAATDDGGILDALSLSKVLPPAL